MPTHYETSEKEEIHYTEDVRQGGSVTSTEEEKKATVNIDNGEAVKSYEGTPEEKAYVRKLNWWILPLVGLIIFVQFCDKASLSVGPVLGLNADLGLTGTQFSLAGSLFYLGHLVYQVPNQFILQRVPHAKYLGFLLVIWGLVMGATAACTTFPQFAACRFLLGLFEAAAMPTLYLITATLYRRKEQAMLFGYITLCNGVGAAIGSAIAFGFAHLDNARGIENWRWNHIVFGSLTVFLGIVTWFCLIDQPDHKLLRLTETEKLIAKDRTRDNAVVKNRVYKYNQIWEALKESRYWLLMIGGLMISLQNGGMLVFSTTFVLGLGFSPMESLLLQIPSGMASALGVFVAVFLAHKTRQLIWSAMFMLSIGIVGLIILCAIPDGAIKLLGYYLSWAGTGSYALLVTLIGNNVKGYTKKIFYNSSIMVAYTVGNFIGPLMMVDHQAPRYLGGVGGFLGGFFVAFCCYFLIRIQGARVNRKRLANKTGEETDVYLDLTDKEDKNFIFRL
ncbi:major facilitator superfamily domain-containing protein [Fennellomyces sp. T-0311]|nr:major facilitator superfamily domain-containing protein [Fennellomyces sp. T-0311]